MFFYEGYSCPVCEQPFTEADDIVTCPECGAPHHRTCWQQEGHCHFAEDHGTERQWKKPVAKTPPETEQEAPKAAQSVKICPHCGSENPGFAEFCSRCGQALPFNEWSQPPNGGQPQRPGGVYNEYAPFHMPTFDPLGGVPKDEDIDGASAEDLALSVGANTAYYIPRFQKMAGKHRSTASKTQWNWPAFLIPPYWLLYRKQYLAGGIVMVFWIVLTILRQFAYQAVFQVVGQDFTVNSIQTAMEDGLLSVPLQIFFLTACAELLMRVILGLIANYLYMRLCVRRVKKLRESNPSGYKLELPRVGGISFAFGMLAYMLIWMSSII